MTEKYKHEANTLSEQYINLYDGACQDRAIDLVNIAELSYARQVGMIAAVIYAHSEDKEEGMRRAKAWIADCIHDVTANIRVATADGFDKLGYPNPFESQTNAKVVADILEKIRGNAGSGKGS